VLTVIDTRKPDAPAHLHKHPYYPFVLCRGPDEAHLTQVGLHTTRHEAEIAMLSIVRVGYDEQVNYARSYELLDGASYRLADELVITRRQPRFDHLVNKSGSVAATLTLAVVALVACAWITFKIVPIAAAVATEQVSSTERVR
jgi:hypothetical protein